MSDESKQLLIGLVIGLVILTIGGFCINANENARDECFAKGGVYLWNEGKCVQGVK